MVDRTGIRFGLAALAFAALAGCQQPTVVGGNPFDPCTYARRADEVAVCSDPTLLELERRLNIGFSNAARARADDDLFADSPFGPSGFRGSLFRRSPVASVEVDARRQSFLLRRADCGANRVCIARLYEQELRYLDWRYGLLPF
jgi:uncharacterized protein